MEQYEHSTCNCNRCSLNELFLASEEPIFDNFLASKQLAHIFARCLRVPPPQTRNLGCVYVYLFSASYAGAAALGARIGNDATAESAWSRPQSGLGSGTTGFRKRWLSQSRAETPRCQQVRKIDISTD